eukprot:gene2340-biopygen1314
MYRTKAAGHEQDGAALPRAHGAGQPPSQLRKRGLFRDRRLYRHRHRSGGCGIYRRGGSRNEPICPKGRRSLPPDAPSNYCNPPQNS